MAENNSLSPSYRLAGRLVRMGGLSVLAAVTPPGLLKLMQDLAVRHNADKLQHVLKLSHHNHHKFLVYYS